MTPSTLELQETLERELGPIERIDRVLSPYSSSYPVEELQVALPNGVELAMIFKNLSPGALLENARVKPDFLCSPFHEIEIYRCLLSRYSLGTAKCFGAVREEGRYWLFLERVNGLHLWQIGEMDVWHNAARWLARLHRQPPSVAHLPKYDRTYYAQTWQRAVAVHPDLVSITDIYACAVDSLLNLPQTFIHGEFYASNVLVDRERICPVDWELAAYGPGLIDLAALTAGNWNARDRLDFTVAYCGGSQPGQDLMRALDCARLHLAVRLLGWSSDWHPPAAHKRNWSLEAFEIAETLA
jgi:Phosphotransferase enzyme family